LDRLAEARRILGHEASTITRLSTLIDGTFDRAVELILRCQGNVVVSGVGKPFFIAQKISASLASTGTPSIPLHPVEALHGDLGLTDGDLRRAILERPAALGEAVGKHMTAGCNTTGPDERVSDALEVMHFHQIDELPVVDAQGKLVGHLDIQDVLR
jgi:arabinose-5-phosphate isomerase